MKLTLIKSEMISFNMAKYAKMTHSSPTSYQTGPSSFQNLYLIISCFFLVRVVMIFASTLLCFVRQNSTNNLIEFVHFESIEGNENWLD